ncbi:hypothetical protein LPN01_09700 [Sphingomonas sp. A2-49]|uniref:hypothetical protein n=1 Tax=Sphingomonas sp. A2-49 TaxID=1391375 RepID=UPI0021D0B828|nr:hypothetical protein [Sphingomonas sp. A2-49]MCU6454353.1 hypothetical protein [Sphingomonas sp. A2-49]
MKIKTLAVAATAFLHLKGPDGTFLYEADKSPVGIDLFGPGSGEFAKIEERQSARTIKRMQDNDNKVAHVPVEQRRAESAEDLADLTADFRNIDHDSTDGTPLVGRALHIAVYSDPALGWIKEQVVKFVGDWGKFTGSSATS